jgi:hypothetical protein
MMMMMMIMMIFVLTIVLRRSVDRQDSRSQFRNIVYSVCLHRGMSNIFIIDGIFCELLFNSVVVLSLVVVASKISDIYFRISHCYCAQFSVRCLVIYLRLIGLTMNYHLCFNFF